MIFFYHATHFYRSLAKAFRLLLPKRTHLLFILRKNRVRLNKFHLKYLLKIRNAKTKMPKVARWLFLEFLQFNFHSIEIGCIIWFRVRVCETFIRTHRVCCIMFVKSSKRLWLARICCFFLCRPMVCREQRPMAIWYNHRSFVS